MPIPLTDAVLKSALQPVYGALVGPNETATQDQAHTPGLIGVGGRGTASCDAAERTDIEITAVCDINRNTWTARRASWGARGGVLPGIPDELDYVTCSGATMLTRCLSRPPSSGTASCPSTP